MKLGAQLYKGYPLLWSFKSICVPIATVYAFEILSEDSLYIPCTFQTKPKEKFPDEKSKEFNLTYLNIILCPICTFKMYNIKSGTTLYLISSNIKEIIIFVKINTRKIIPLSVNPRCTIYSIKKKLLQIHDIDIDKFIYELQIYPFTNNSIINASKDDKPIKLNTHATLNKYCNVFDFELQTLPTTTISALKEQIISHLEYPKVDATLICNNELLCIDNKTLADHCIENNDYIEFFFYAKKCVDLHIFTNDGKYILLEPLYTDRIINIKEQIHEKEGIPIDRQKLFLNNIELNDKDAIQAYTFGGRLDLVYSLDQCFIISIKDRDQVFPIDAKQNDTIKCIKNKIMSKEKYLIEDRKLYIFLLWAFSLFGFFDDLERIFVIIFIF